MRIEFYRTLREINNLGEIIPSGTILRYADAFHAFLRYTIDATPFERMMAMYCPKNEADGLKTIPDMKTAISVLRITSNLPGEEPWIEFIESYEAKSQNQNPATKNWIIKFERSRTIREEGKEDLIEKSKFAGILTEKIKYLPVGLKWSDAVPDIAYGSAKKAEYAVISTQNYNNNPDAKPEEPTPVPVVSVP